VTAKVWAITRREYLERVRTRWFLISTFGLPLVLVALMFLPNYLISSGGSGDSAIRVGVVDLGRGMSEELGRTLEEGWIVKPLESSAGDTEGELREILLRADLDAVLLLSVDIGEGGEARLLTRQAISSRQERAMRLGIRDALVAVRLRERGLDEVNTDWLLRGADLQVTRISAEGEQSREIFQALAMVFAGVTYMMFLVYGQLIVRAVLEEKTSYVVEVMVSSVRPWEMMLGKMFGVGAVGLTQIGIWVVVAGLLATFGLSGAAAALAERGIDLSQLRFPVGLFAWALTYFVLGYFLYAGLFLAAGASLSNEQDAQQVVTPLVLVILVGFVLVISVIETPDSPWAVVGSLIPLFSPMIVPARLAISHVPFWELAVSLTLLVLSLLGAAWVAGRIYRVGVLMRGKRPSLPELLRWVRHG
jgi:ABC-2 type transport system permease protein